MKPRLICLAIAAWTFTSPATASIAISAIDVLDGTDPGAPSPPGLVVVDIAVDVSDDDAFGAAQIFAQTTNGARLVYRLVQGQPSFFPPRMGDRYVSFGSCAYGRNDLPRFAPAGTPMEPTIGLYGEPTPEFLPNRVQVAYHANPPFPFSDRLGLDGFVMRLAIDVTDVAIPGAEDVGNYRIFEPGKQPSAFQPVLISDGSIFGNGTSVSSYLGGFVEENWGLYVPEPLSGVLLLMGALVLLRVRA